MQREKAAQQNILHVKHQTSSKSPNRLDQQQTCQDLKSLLRRLSRDVYVAGPPPAEFHHVVGGLEVLQNTLLGIQERCESKHGRSHSTGRKMNPYRNETDRSDSKMLDKNFRSVLDGYGRELKEANGRSNVKPSVSNGGSKDGPNMEAIRKSLAEVAAVVEEVKGSKPYAGKSQNQLRGSWGGATSSSEVSTGYSRAATYQDGVTNQAANPPSSSNWRSLSSNTRSLLDNSAAANPLPNRTDYTTPRVPSSASVHTNGTSAAYNPASLYTHPSDRAADEGVQYNHTSTSLSHAQSPALLSGNGTSSNLHNGSRYEKPAKHATYDLSGHNYTSSTPSAPSNSASQSSNGIGHYAASSYNNPAEGTTYEQSRHTHASSAFPSSSFTGLSSAESKYPVSHRPPASSMHASSSSQYVSTVLRANSSSSDYVPMAVGANSLSSKYLPAALGANSSSSQSAPMTVGATSSSPSLRSSGPTSSSTAPENDRLSLNAKLHDASANLLRISNQLNATQTTPELNGHSHSRDQEELEKLRKERLEQDAVITDLRAVRESLQSDIQRLVQSEEAAQNMAARALSDLAGLQKELGIALQDAQSSRQELERVKGRLDLCTSDLMKSKRDVEETKADSRRMKVENELVKAELQRVLHSRNTITAELAELRAIQTSAEKQEPTSEVIATSSACSKCQDATHQLLIKDEELSMLQAQVSGQESQLSTYRQQISMLEHQLAQPQQGTKEDLKLRQLEDELRAMMVQMETKQKEGLKLRELEVELTAARKEAEAKRQATSVLEERLAESTRLLEHQKAATQEQELKAAQASRKVLALQEELKKQCQLVAERSQDALELQKMATLEAEVRDLRAKLSETKEALRHVQAVEGAPASEMEMVNDLKEAQYRNTQLEQLLEAAIQEHAHEVATLHSEIAQIRESSSQAGRLARSLAEAEQKVVDLESQIRKERVQHHNRVEADLARGTAVVANEQLEVLQAENARLAERVEQLEKADEQLAAVKAECARLTQRLQQLSTAEEQLTVSESKCAKLAERVKQLEVAEEQLAGARTESAKLAEQVRQLTSAAAANRKRMEDLDAIRVEARRLAEQLEFREIEVGDLRQQNEAYEECISDLESNVNNIQTTLMQVESEKKTLEERCRAVEAAHAEMRRRMEEMAGSQGGPGRLRETEQALHQVRSELAKAQQQLEAAQKQCESLSASVTAKEEELVLMDGKVQVLRKEVVRLRTGAHTWTDEDILF